MGFIPDPTGGPSSLETGIVTYLNAYAPLTAIVGTHIYPHKAVESPTKPYITYRLIGRPLNVQTATGKMVATAKRVQFDVFADTMAVGAPLSDILHDALLTMWGPYEVGFLDERDPDDPSTGLFNREIDVRFTHGGY